MKHIPQNLNTIELGKMYSIRDLSEITGIPENIIRNRKSRYKPVFEIIDGHIYFQGSVAVDFLRLRKRGRK